MQGSIIQEDRSPRFDPQMISCLRDMRFSGRCVNKGEFSEELQSDGEALGFSVSNLGDLSSWIIDPCMKMNPKAKTAEPHHHFGVPRKFTPVHATTRKSHITQALDLLGIKPGGPVLLDY